MPKVALEMATDRVARVVNEASLRIVDSMLDGEIWERRVIRSVVGGWRVLGAPTVVGGHDEAGQVRISGRGCWRGMSMVVGLGDVSGADAIVRRRRNR
ncbi:hypothetical protein ES702_01487 [subsurface metagenome]